MKKLEIEDVLFANAVNGVPLPAHYGALSELERKRWHVAAYVAFALETSADLFGELNSTDPEVSNVLPIRPWITDAD